MVKLIPNLTRGKLESFFSAIKVDASRGCWNWFGYVLPSGYGQIKINSKNFRSHRVAYFIAFERQPGEKIVCHRCDNRRCCNPSHLFLGTNAANSADMVQKGRSSTRGNPKLNREQVLRIRRSDASLDSLAKQYGVTKSAVCMIRNRKTWRDT